VPRAQWHRREPVLATSVLKRDSITLEFRQSDPSSPAFFPGSDRLQDAMLVSITTAYPPVRHVDCAHLSRYTDLHLLCFFVSVRPCSAVLVPQLSTSLPDQEENTTRVLITIDGTGERASRICFHSVRCLPMQALRAILAMWVIRAHTSQLAATSRPQYTPDRLIGHAVITCDLSQRFTLLDPLQQGRPFRVRDLPTRIRHGGKVARQRQKPRVVKGRGERIFLR